MSSIKIHPLIIKLFASAFYPIGKVEIFYDEADHSNYLGLKWERTSLERSPIGYNPNSSDTKYRTIGNQFGEEKHTLTTSEIPAHSHNYNGTSDDVYSAAVTSGSGEWYKHLSGWSRETSVVGGEQPHNTIHPVEVMAFWRRIE